MEGKVCTQFRIAEALYAEVKELADAVGDSINGTMLHLMKLGLRLYKEGVVIPLEK